MRTTPSRNTIIFSALAILLLFPSSSTLAVGHRALSDEEIGAVSQNCSSILTRLRRVQKDDARNRIYLGAQYEAISSKLMLNLNLRLIKNGFADADLAEQQTTFTSERERFKNDYIGYSQEFEELLKLDCKKEPAKFYRQLENVRAKRSDIDASMNRMRETLSSHHQSVEEFKGKIDEK